MADLAGSPPAGYCRKCGEFLGGSPKIYEQICPGSAGKPAPPYLGDWSQRDMLQPRDTLAAYADGNYPDAE